MLERERFITLRTPMRTPTSSSVPSVPSTESPPPAPSRPTPAAVVVEHVSLAFDDRIVLRDVSFSVPKSSMWMLLGASGSGKSMLLKLILGLLRPDAGRIFVNGQRVDDMHERDLLELRADIGMLFQESALFDSLTVEENVGYRLAEEAHMPSDEVRGRVEEVLAFLGLGAHIDRLPSQLSGGQRRRVAIARAIASNPSLLLLDDPAVGLDPLLATTVDDEIVKLRDLQHVTAIVATHQMRDAFYIARHTATGSEEAPIEPAAEGESSKVSFIVLHDGRIHFEGRGADLLASEDAYLKKFLDQTLPPW